MKFRIAKEDGEYPSRIGEFRLNGHRAQTPMAWLVQGADSHYQVWRDIEAENLLISAYNVLKRPRLCQRILRYGIHRHLQFDGLIFMDSGGFSFLNQERVDVSPATILRIYEGAKPDIAAVLDHPLDPANTAGNSRRWRTTLSNTRYTLMEEEEIPIVPVVHGYRLDDLKRACDDIREIASEPPIVAVGGFASLLRSSRGRSSRRAIEYLARAVRLVREEFPDSLLHSFGVGAPRPMTFVFSLGVDSTDSIGWRKLAGYGQITLVGGSIVRISFRGKPQTTLTSRQKELLRNCECPVCRDRTLRERIEAFGTEFQCRATHNAWVYLKERSLYLSALEEGRLDSYLKQRLHSSMYFDIITKTLHERTLLS